MLLVSPVWLMPQPVSSHVEETQIMVQEQVQSDDGRGILQPEQNIQPSDDQPIQKVKPTNAISVQTNLISEHQTKSSPSRKSGNGDSRQAYSGRNYSIEEVQAFIIAYSEQYGINAETPLCIAKFESGYNQFSKNKSSSASGVFQYLAGTWRATDEAKQGWSVFDAEQNVKAAIKYMSVHKTTRPWVVANKCPQLTFTK